MENRQALLPLFQSSSRSQLLSANWLTLKVRSNLNKLKSKGPGYTFQTDGWIMSINQINKCPREFCSRVNVLRNRQMNFTNSTCLDYHNVLEHADTCYNPSQLEMSVQFLNGFLLIMAFPAILIGIILNIILVSRLLKKIKRPRQLHILAAAIAIVDIGTFAIFVIQLCDTLTIRWINTFHFALRYTHQLACKSTSFINEFMTVLRVNFLCYAVFHQIEMREHSRCKTQNRYWSVICMPVVFLVSLIQALPAAILPGIWQCQGMLICFPDPQWAAAYHLYYFLHKIVFVDGALQCVYLFILEFLLLRHKKRSNKIAVSLAGKAQSGELTSIVKTGVMLEHLDLCTNYRIMSPQIWAMCFTRFAWCLSDALLSVEWFKTFTKRRDLFIQNFRLYFMLVDCVFILEVILTNLNLFWWYKNIPFLHMTIPCKRKVAKSNKKEKISTNEEVSLDKQFYFMEAATKRNDCRVNSEEKKKALEILNTATKRLISKFPNVVQSTKNEGSTYDMLLPDLQQIGANLKSTLSNAEKESTRNERQ